MKKILFRKLVASAVCITVYPIIMLFIFKPYDADPNFFIYLMDEIDGVFGLFILHTAIFLLYGLPVSFGIEFLTNLIYRIPKLNNSIKHMLKHIFTLLLLLLFSLLFGPLVMFFSIISAITMFVIDFILQLTKREFTYTHTLIIALLPLSFALWVYMNTTNW